MMSWKVVIIRPWNWLKDKNSLWKIFPVNLGDSINAWKGFWQPVMIKEIEKHVVFVSKMEVHVANQKICFG